VTPSGRTTDIVKDLFTYATAAAVVLLGMFWVKQLVDSHAITGAEAMVVFVGAISAATGFLFGVALARSGQRAYEKGVNTPGPNDNGTTIQADSGPTTVTKTD
jgi:hypothetical protein